MAGLRRGCEVIVDVHGHITHPELFKKYPMPPALADIEGMLDRKSEAGIGLTVVGSPVGFGTMTRMPGPRQLRPAARSAQVVPRVARRDRGQARPRLAAYAYTNPLGGDELLEQTAQTVRDGGFVGLIVNTSVKGEYLDSERADPFFEMASELGVPVFLHPPAEPVGSDSLADFRLVEQVGRFMDVTVGLAALVFAGRLEQYPDLDFIAATAGGAIALAGGSPRPGLPAAPLGRQARRRPARRRASRRRGRSGRRWAAPDDELREQDQRAAEHLPAERVRRHGHLERAQPPGQPRADGRRITCCSARTPLRSRRRSRTRSPWWRSCPSRSEERGQILEGNARRLLSLG